MKRLKTFEEYRYLKIDPSKDNVKDPNEPFFMEPKYSYKHKKRIFGDGSGYWRRWVLFYRPGAEIKPSIA